MSRLGKTRKTKAANGAAIIALLTALVSFAQKALDVWDKHHPVQPPAMIETALKPLEHAPPDRLMAMDPDQDVGEVESDFIVDEAPLSDIAGDSPAPESFWTLSGRVGAGSLIIALVFFGIAGILKRAEREDGQSQ